MARCCPCLSSPRRHPTGIAFASQMHSTDHHNTRGRKPVALSVYLRRLFWLGVLPLVLLAALLAAIHVDSLNEQREIAADNIARSLALGIDEYLRARIDALQMLANSPNIDDSANWSKLCKRQRISLIDKRSRAATPRYLQRSWRQRYVPAHGGYTGTVPDCSPWPSRSGCSESHWLWPLLRYH
jgi:hypothetical protein